MTFRPVTFAFDATGEVRYCQFSIDEEATLLLNDYMKMANREMFAELLEVDITTLSRWATGSRRPSPDMAAKIERQTAGIVTFRECFGQERLGKAATA